MKSCVAALLLLLVGCYGPPDATLREAHDANGSASFDHQLLDDVLKQHVDADGWADYAGLKTDSANLDQYIDTLASAPFDALGRDAKLALLINAYNALTLRLILDHYPLKSIRDIPAAQRWDAVRWKVGGRTLSLTQIEHEELRAKFSDPRIHFAINCASVGCPPLRPEAYDVARIDEQLDDQMRYTHSRDRWLKLDRAGGVVHLTQLYKWYGGDFEQVAPSVLAYAAQHNANLKAAGNVDIAWLDYDWSLNAQGRP